MVTSSFYFLCEQWVIDVCVCTCYISVIKMVSYRQWAGENWFNCWEKQECFSFLPHSGQLSSLHSLLPMCWMYGMFSITPLYFSMLWCLGTRKFVLYLCVWYTHIIVRIHSVHLVIRVWAWGDTGTIECHTSNMTWSIEGIIDIKLITVSVSLEDSCYCVFKPENKWTCFRKCCSIDSLWFNN